MYYTKYKRLLLNISGEFFPHKAPLFANLIAKITPSCNIAVVCGGGNILRGGRNNAQQMDRAIADQIGMTSTIINSLFLYEALQKFIPTRIFSALHMQNIDNYNPFIVRDAFNSGTTVLLAGGTGQGYMSTDTTAILRAKELQCDAWIKITKYDHIYDRDPSLDTSAKELHNVTYHQILQEQLGIMDLSAAAIGVSNGPPLIIANGNNIDELWEKIDEKEVVT